MKHRQMLTLWGPHEFLPHEGGGGVLVNIYLAKVEEVGEVGP